MLRIETSTLCSCGTHVELHELPAFARDVRWQAWCARCLDPVEDAAERDKVVGAGKTPDEALWDWQESCDEAWGVEWHPVTTVIELEQQITAERARQRGWTVTVPDEFVEHVCYGPPCAAESESNV